MKISQKIGSLGLIALLFAACTPKEKPTNTTAAPTATATTNRELEIKLNTQCKEAEALLETLLEQAVEQKHLTAQGAEKILAAARQNAQLAQQLADTKPETMRALGRKMSDAFQLDDFDEYRFSFKIVRAYQATIYREFVTDLPAAEESDKALAIAYLKLKSWDLFLELVEEFKKTDIFCDQFEVSSISTTPTVKVGETFSADIQLNRISPRALFVVEADGKTVKPQEGRAKITYKTTSADIGTKTIRATANVTNPLTGEVLDFPAEIRFEVVAK